MPQTEIASPKRNLKGPPKKGGGTPISETTDVGQIRPTCSITCPPRSVVRSSFMRTQTYVHIIDTFLWPTVPTPATCKLEQGSAVKAFARSPSKATSSRLLPPTVRGIGVGV